MDEIIEARDENGWSALHWAAKDNEKALVSVLIEHGAPLEARENMGKTPFMIAVQHRKHSNIELLLDAGAAVDATDTEGKTALVKLIEDAGMKNLETIELLLGRGAGTDQALLLAAGKGKFDFIQLLVERGASIDAPVDVHGKTALMLAAENYSDKTTKYLLARTSNIEAKDNEGRTVLMIASSVGNSDAIRLLLCGGVAIEARDNKGRTALLIAIENHRPPGWSVGLTRNLDAIKLLVESDADIEAKDNEGRTAMTIAVSLGHDDVVNFLAIHGAIDSDKAAAKSEDAKRQAKEFQEAVQTFHAAVQSGQYHTVEQMLHAGMEVDVKDEKGHTALMWAVENANTRLVQLLLARGASVHKDGCLSVDLASRTGDVEVFKLLSECANAKVPKKTWNSLLEKAYDNEHFEIVCFLLKEYPFVYRNAARARVMLFKGVKKGHVEMVKLLLSRGVAIEAKDDEENTALIHAAWQGNLEMTSLLLQSGADIDARDGSRMSALMVAALRGHIEVVKLLLQEVVKKKLQEKEMVVVYTTALTYAARGGHVDVINLLLEKGAVIEEIERGHGTALQWAIKNGHTGVLELLLDRAAAAVNQKDLDRLVRYAVENRCAAAVGLLLDRGASIEASALRDDNYYIQAGDTLLTMAVKKGDAETVQVLIGRGAVVPRTILVTAVKQVGWYGSCDVITALLTRHRRGKRKAE